MNLSHKETSKRIIEDKKLPLNNNNFCEKVGLYLNLLSNFYAKDSKESKESRENLNFRVKMEKLYNKFQQDYEKYFFMKLEVDKMHEDLFTSIYSQISLNLEEIDKLNRQKRILLYLKRI